MDFEWSKQCVDQRVARVYTVLEKTTDRQY